MKDSIEVLIIGAGPTGLTAAVDLARRKIPFRIIDRAAHPARESRAAGVWARTLEMLSKLEVTEAMLKRGNPLGRLQAWAGGRPFLEFDVGAADTEFPFVLVLPQDETERILTERLEALGGEIERLVEALDLRQDADSVRVTVARGARGREVIRARWVLACDGAHSLSRKALGLGFPGAAYHPTFALADVSVEWGEPLHCARVFLDANGPVAFLPFREPRGYRIIAQLPPTPAAEATAHGVPEELGLVDFEELLDGRIPVRVRLSHPRWIARFHIHHRCVDSFRVGRTFLVGDAAHIHSPVGGQGMNTGIQDALNLTWKLALVIRGAAGPGILDTYQSERLPVAKAVIRGTDIATQLATIGNTWLQSARNRVLRFVSGVDFVRRRLANAASELMIRYDPGPLVGSTRRPRRGVLPAGRRAPDAELQIGQNRRRLSHWLAECEHAFVLFSGPPNGDAIGHVAEEVVRRFGAWASVLVVSSGAPPAKGTGMTVAADTTGELHRKYGVHRTALFWVRPDGYIGYRSEPPELDACEAFLSRVFDLRKMPARATRALGKARGPRARAR